VKNHDNVDDAEHSDDQGRQDVQDYSVVDDTVLVKDSAFVISQPKDENHKGVDQKSVDHSHVIQKQFKDVRLFFHGLFSLSFSDLCSFEVFFVFALIAAVLFFLFFDLFAVLEQKLSLVAVVFLQGLKIFAFESAFIL
jgi:hypothetical protein